MQFAGSGTAVQFKSIAMDEDAVAVSPVGVEGAAAQLGLVTVSKAVVLVTEPAASVTTTLKLIPLSVATVAGVV